ncbi:transposase [Candidatus Magnetomorum sp. HK-1]|nr:transposase [Candidatus Magnetomorum sp. HK-1]
MVKFCDRGRSCRKPLTIKYFYAIFKIMPRLARLDAPGVLHHVMGRGIEQNEIFLNNEDRKDFIKRLEILALDNAIDVYAWTLLPNHFHLLIKTKERPLSSTMRKLLTGYVVNYNKRHMRHGHLFQNRYKSIVCQEDVYLNELVRYIHLNLLRAKIVKSLNKLNLSPWSGHSALMGKVKRNWQNTDYVLSLFGNKRNRRKNYLAYVEKGIKKGHRPELVGGGLIRSMGGWSEVIALRERGDKNVYDQRILGESDFVEKIVSDLDEMAKRNLKRLGKRIDLEKLAEKICNKFDISMNELCSGSRRKIVIKARQIVSWLAVRELGYTGADVAYFLGVTNSCVTRIVSGTKPDLKKFMKLLR